MKKYILALDQGTTSSRAIVFDHEGQICSIAQKEFQQYFPKPGWVEHNPNEIWASEASVIAEAISTIDINGLDIAAIGITNQRETTIVWDIDTEEPIYNAIVWQDRRTAAFCDQLKAEGITDTIHQKTGLIIDAYFSGTKIKWILDHVPGARKRAEQGKLRFGNVDSWLVWRLTRGEVHVTDVTNASRTMLFNIHDLKWDEDLLKLLDIPASMMPEVKSNSEIYGHTKTTIFAHKVPIAGIAGDQQAALFGQMCLEPGSIKNTYGTGCFMLMNTGTEPVFSDNGLLTTVAYKIGDQAPVYALEGSIAVAGSLVQWLRDNLGMIVKSSDIGELASTVEDNGGVYFVPAFSGLFAPYWRSDARGAIVGLTRYVNKGHIARAVEESTAFQSAEVLDAMNADAGVPLKELKVDGGMTHDDLVMQFQADLCGVDVVRPKVIETTALGAAYAAGMAVGYWSGTDDVVANWQEGKRWTPSMEPAERDRTYRLWKKAVTRTLDWVDDDVL